MATKDTAIAHEIKSSCKAPYSGNWCLVSDEWAVQVGNEKGNRASHETFLREPASRLPLNHQNLVITVGFSYLGSAREQAGRPPSGTFLLLSSHLQK
jgi:hypothetical protein